MPEQTKLLIFVFLAAYLLICIVVPQEPPISDENYQWNPVFKEGEMYFDNVTKTNWNTYSKIISVSESPTTIPNPSNGILKFAWKSDEKMKFVREINLSIGGRIYELRGDENEWLLAGPYPVTIDDNIKLIFYYNIGGKLWIAFPPKDGNQSLSAELRLFMPQHMCRSKEFCLFFWIESPKNISRASLKIDKPKCFKEINYSGTGIFEDVEAAGDKYFSLPQKEVKTGSLTVYFSILPSAINNVAYIINVNELNFETESGEVIQSSPIAGNLTVDKFVDIKYTSNFEKNGYDPSLLAVSEYRECFEDMVDHMSLCA